jgi:hypothetical protein
MTERKKDTDKEGRGVLIAVRKYLISSDVYEFAHPDKTKMVWAKIEIAGSKTLYLGSYYNPKTSDENSLKNFDTMIRKASQLKNSAIIVGVDFNLPGWDWRTRTIKPPPRVGLAHQENKTKHQIAKSSLSLWKLT